MANRRTTGDLTIISNRVTSNKNSRKHGDQHRFEGLDINWSIGYDKHHDFVFV